MHEILLDIQQRLRRKEYKNEEHVRLSLVARVVQELGWDIWNPTEVFTEFKATKKEDHTRVDVALFTRDFEDTAIFIECKGVGAFATDLGRSSGSCATTTATTRPFLPSSPTAGTGGSTSRLPAASLRISCFVSSTCSRMG